MVTLGYLSVIAIWIGLWVVCLGWGVLAFRAVGCKTNDDPVGLLLAPWVGVACVLAFLQVWHWFLPVAPWSLLVVSLLGLVGGAMVANPVAVSLARSVAWHPMLWLLGAALTLLLVNRASGTQEYNDNGLYYLNAIHWNADYPVVIGLGNLQTRFAFNNSNFLLHAMFRLGPWEGHTGQLINGFFCAIALPLCIFGFFQALGRHSEGRSTHATRLAWFALAPAMIVAVVAIDRRISTANSGVVAALLLTVAFWRLLAIDGFAGREKDASFRRELVAFALLSSAAVSAKASVVFAAALGWVVMAIFLLRESRRESGQFSRDFSRPMTILILGALLLMVPWVARGYMISGYPLFPSQVAGAPVEWRVSEEDCDVATGFIYAWARTTHNARELGRRDDFAWVPHWLVQVVMLRAPLQVVAPCGLTLVSFALLFWFGRPSRAVASSNEGDPIDVSLNANGERHAWLIACAYALSLVAWFFTAPSPRMGVFSWWGLAAVLIGMMMSRYPHATRGRARGLIAATLCLLLIAPMLHKAALIEFRYRFNEEMVYHGQRAWQLYPFIVPTEGRAYPPPPEPDMYVTQTESGLEVYLTTKGLPWDSDLPATLKSEFKPTLRLRRPGDLGSGFVVDRED